MKNQKAGFSVVELIIVIAIIGILAAVLIIALPKVISESNAKSALSDAKNALTQTIDKFGEGQAISDTVFIVEKAKKSYVFGYINQYNRIIACAQNPFETYDVEIEKLLENSVIAQTANPAEITKDIKDISENVRVYSGYLLKAINEQIILSESNIKVALGTTHNLSADVIPYGSKEIQWSSSDIKIATVSENGEISGLAEGTTTITVQAGTLSETCEVTVCTYTEFSGNFSELKQIIEDKSENYLFLKIKDEGASIYSNIESLFPITIPYGKTVHLDMNSADIAFDDDGVEGEISSVFYNDGGKLYFESTGYIIGSDKGKNTLVNANGGTVYMLGGAYFTGRREVGTAQEATILNMSGSKIIFDNAEAGGQIGVDGYFISNLEGATLTILDCRITGVNLNKHLIYNAGEIDVIKGGEIIGLSGTAIENKGVISSISGGKIGVINVTDEDLSIYDYAYPIYNLNGGKISEITGGEIKSENIGTLGKQHAVVFEGNFNIGSITGGTIKGVDGDFLYNGGEKAIISGGQFLHEVKAELLAKGYSCTFDSETQMFVVKQ